MSGHEEGNVYLIDKELGWTSFDVVRKLRKITGERKIGHAGTLDPLATGLLILCSGPMTRRIGNYMESEKEYTGTLVLGKSTASFDLETEVREVADCRHLAETDIRRAAGAFVGDLMQVPPAYSAIKVAGKRSYKHARRGVQPELQPRPVNVKLFEITGIELPEVHFRLVCSKGFYVRSLVRDLGEKLEVGAYLSALRRTRIGSIRIEEATSVAQLENLLQPPSQ
jgi:tRNA pseudouridine55 synthase